MRGKSLATGLACVALAVCWQALTVRYNYGGNWTGLFCTGANQRIPRDLLGEGIHALPASFGYDGQFYHYIAHDPLGRTTLPDYVDAPRFRYRRILVPGLAYLLAAGNAHWIDEAYFGIVLLFVFLGGYWMSRFAAWRHRHAAWGLLFLALPATLTSIDRMTVDVALAALWAGFAAYTVTGHNWRAYLVLISAPLVRETGLAMTVAFCFWSLVRKDRRRALAGAATALPFAAWFLYVQGHFGAYRGGWLSNMPLQDLLGVVQQPFSSPWGTLSNVAVISADFAALAGSLVAIGLALRWSRARPGSALELSVVLLGGLGVVMALFGSRDIWVHVYGHARLLSPLLLLLALRSLERRAWSDLTPLPLLMPRIGLQFASDALRVVRGVTGL